MFPGEFLIELKSSRKQIIISNIIIIYLSIVLLCFDTAQLHNFDLVLDRGCATPPPLPVKT